MFTDNLEIFYERFPEEDITVLTVGRGDEAVWMFDDEEADFIYSLLKGDDEALERLQKIMED